MGAHENLAGLGRDRVPLVVPSVAAQPDAPPTGDTLSPPVAPSVPRVRRPVEPRPPKRGSAPPIPDPGSPEEQVASAFPIPPHVDEPVSGLDGLDEGVPTPVPFAAIDPLPPIDDVPAGDNHSPIPMTPDPLYTDQLPIDPPTPQPEPLPEPPNQLPVEPPILHPLPTPSPVPFIPIVPQHQDTPEEPVPVPLGEPAPDFAPEPPEETPETSQQRWTMNACWRLISSDLHALDHTSSFTGEEIIAGTDGLHQLHKDVGSSLQAHLRTVQKREWDHIRVPNGNSAVHTEKAQAARWEKAKLRIAEVISRTIVPDPSTGEKRKLAQGEVLESFAYKLHYWMQESMRIMISLYQERPDETAKISNVLALIGFADMPVSEGKEIKRKQYQAVMMRSLWQVYQELHMKGKNSSVEFIRQVATGIKAQNGGQMNEEELYYAMDIFRKLPLFGKEGDLMDAIELATVAVSQPADAYIRGVTIAPLDSHSREGKAIAFIQKKIPLTSERRFPSSTRRGRRGASDDTDEEEIST